MEYFGKNAKLGRVGTQPKSRDLLLNFGTASVSLERLKLETSNLVPRVITRTTIENIQKLGKNSRGLCHLTNFYYI